MSFADDFRGFAFDLTRAHARLLQSGIADDPNRVAPPEFAPEQPAFDALPFGQQLDAADVACRRDLYRRALLEALPESDEYERLMANIVNSCIPDAEIGRMAREIVVAYLQRVAIQNEENLRDFA